MPKLMIMLEVCCVSSLLDIGANRQESKHLPFFLGHINSVLFQLPSSSPIELKGPVLVSLVIDFVQHNKLGILYSNKPVRRLVNELASLFVEVGTKRQIT